MPASTLRKRLLTASTALGILENNVAHDLKSETLLKFQSKLLPILSTSYYDQVEGSKANTEDALDFPKTKFALKHTLHVPIVTVTNLTVQPGEPHFIIWLLISSFFPLVAACMAPLGNLISLIGLVEHWRVDTTTGKYVKDIDHVFALNITSFVMGIIGNISLLMNFSGKMRYLVTQCVSIFCWVVATTFLLIGVLLTNPQFTGSNPRYARSEGFWLAVFTIFMYSACSAILIINFVGYKCNKYPPTFNLDRKQRLLMSYTIAFSVWQTVGTLAMAHLIDDLTYGASLYYCTVSMLTIGLGDIVPVTPGAKVFALVFSLIGVIIMGLIIATIRQVVLSSAGPSIFWHFVEKGRLDLLRKVHVKNMHLSAEESFDQMRLLRTKVKLSQNNVSLMISLSLFLIFLLIGALVFYYTESWDYFNAVYFCFLCLVTIGYGDFHPTSALGRVFFVQWAITAVPLMTILISNLGDTIYDFAHHVDTAATFFLSWRTYAAAFGSKKRVSSESVHDEEDPELQVAKEGTDLLTEDSESVLALTDGQEYTESERALLERHKASTLILDRLSALRVAMFDSIEDPDKRYTLDEWSEAFTKFESQEGGTHDDPDFWLSDDSPLRLPIKEPNYLLVKMFFRIERDLQEILKAQKQALLQISDKPTSTIDERIELSESLPHPRQITRQPKNS